MKIFQENKCFQIPALNTGIKAVIFLMETCYVFWFLLKLSQVTENPIVLGISTTMLLFECLLKI